MEGTKLYERITAANWLQGYLHDTNERRHCLMGHVEVLALELWDADTQDADLTAFEDECTFKLTEAIEVLYPDRYKHGIAHFNDDERTTVEDVIRVCKLADV